MQLKFYAKPEHVVHYPGPRFAGQIHNYVGRQFVAHTDDKLAQESRVAGQNRATEDGFDVDSESPEGAVIADYARKGGLWCANSETASAVGVEFVRLKFDSKAFEWFPDAATIAKPSKSPAQPE